MRTKECEVQLSLARAEEQRKRAEDEAKKSRTLNSQVSTFSQTETELRSQLNIYVEKFKQVGPSLLRTPECRHQTIYVPTFVEYYNWGWRTDCLFIYNLQSSIRFIVYLTLDLRWRKPLTIPTSSS